ncbi:uncharacterized protein V1513DRAFT_428305 [Lipomyces chichibuensis]|uniref:uncharacterized protein n=1 Tax=Lipomyces chichibuensis TaxID=1546026 RepID=UPI0033431A70
MGSSQDDYATNLSVLLSIASVGVCVFYFMFNHQTKRVKSSAVLVKSPYVTEFLSDALSAKYDVCINTDALLASRSYHRSWFKSSALVPTESPEETTKIRCGLAILMASYGLNSMILAYRALKRYVESDEAFIIEAFDFVRSLLSLLLLWFVDIAIMKNFFKPKDARQVTIYVNTDDENWVKSLDDKAFNSSEHLEVSIKWVGVVLCLGLASIAFLYSIVVLCIETLGMVFDRREAGSKVILPVVYSVFIAAFSCVALVKTTKIIFRMIRRRVETLEVQLAQSVRDKDGERAHVLKFDVAKVVQMFATEIAKCGEKSIASVGTYCDFVITDAEGALVYGRLRAKGISEIFE